MPVPPKLVAELADALDLMTRSYPGTVITFVVWPQTEPSSAAVIANIPLALAKDNLRELLQGPDGKQFTYKREEH